MVGADSDDRSGRQQALTVAGPPWAESAAMRLPTWGQVLAIVVIAASGLWIAQTESGPAKSALALSIPVIFLLWAFWRLALVLLSERRPQPVPPPAQWPRYTVVAALYDEQEVIPQLIERLSRIDYPQDRLEGFLALEAHDNDTFRAAMAVERPAWLQILIVPPGRPQTKPRALNHALARATGDLICVYDAEDDPDPLQLREAAARFASDRNARLACLQAPLRIRRRHAAHDASPFFDRQFAIEYAALFEVVIPAMARLGFPFPLGGTSNHFRVDVLRHMGGWDPWNVTEDADLGFRLWRHGYRLGAIERPTYEAPPGGIEHWLPQRCRWLKGYLQTFGVHSRDPFGLGVRGGIALITTLGASLIAAAAHGPSLAWVIVALVTAADARITPAMPLAAVSALILGAASAWLSGAIGARRAGVPYGIRDMLASPAYWALLSLAFVHAAWRLITEPFTWDKTAHHPDPVEAAEAATTASNDLDAGRRAA